MNKISPIVSLYQSWIKKVQMADSKLSPAQAKREAAISVVGKLPIQDLVACGLSLCQEARMEVANTGLSPELAIQAECAALALASKRGGAPASHSMQVAARLKRLTGLSPAYSNQEQELVAPLD